jgi:hypothetical protein
MPHAKNRPPSTLEGKGGFFAGHFGYGKKTSKAII